MKSGIYNFRNTQNGKRYVGSAVDLEKRKRLHEWRLSNNRHANAALQAAWNKYGADAFAFEILEHTKRELLIEREQFYIESLKSTSPSGYNLCPTAGSTLGRKFSEETKEKIRAKHLGRAGLSGKENPQYGLRGGLSPYYGKKRSKDVCDRIAVNRSGKICTLIAPDGTVFKDVKNIKGFARDHGLVSTSLSRVVNGVLRKHHGWTGFIQEFAEPDSVRKCDQRRISEKLSYLKNTTPEQFRSAVRGALSCGLKKKYGQTLKVLSQYKSGELFLL